MSNESQAASNPDAHQRDAVAVYSVARPGTEAKVDHIVVYGHSNLFYWWPVWLISFILAGVTSAGGGEPGLPGEAVSGNGPGAVFVVTLLAVAVSSTVLLRGMMSVLVAVAAVAVAVTFAWFGWWDNIFGYLGGLDIRINTAGYLCVGVPLFLAWLVVMVLYDRQHYVVFGRGQIRYVQEVGDSEMVIPSEGASVEKRRSDGFRHWILGLGAGAWSFGSEGRTGRRSRWTTSSGSDGRCQSSTGCCERRRSPWIDPPPIVNSHPERGDAMADETREPARLDSDSTHATEVRDAQAAIDEVGKRRRATSVPGREAAVDLRLLHGLVAAHGADEVCRMINSLK